LEPDGLAAFVTALEADDFEAGRWHDSEPLADGSFSMPWYELSATAEAFLRAVGEGGWLMPTFPWPTWAPTPEAIALRTDRDALAVATPEPLGKLLTMLIRENRFVEGALGDSFESGLMAAIARRAQVLAKADGRPATDAL
jgi:hypothetical protein